MPGTTLVIKFNSNSNNKSEQENSQMIWNYLNEIFSLEIETFFLIDCSLWYRSVYLGY